MRTNLKNYHDSPFSSPAHRLVRLQRKLANWLESIYPLANHRGEQCDWYSPRLVLSEDPAGYVMEINLEGLKKETIEVGVENNLLKIKGMWKGQEEEGIPEKVYQKSFSLPRDADSQEMSLSWKRSVIALMLPKKTQSPPPGAPLMF